MEQTTFYFECNPIVITRIYEEGSLVTIATRCGNVSLCAHYRTRSHDGAVRHFFFAIRLTCDGSQCPDCPSAARDPALLRDISSHERIQRFMMYQVIGDIASRSMDASDCVERFCQSNPFGTNQSWTMVRDKNWVYQELKSYTHQAFAKCSVIISPNQILTYQRKLKNGYRNKHIHYQRLYYQLDEAAYAEACVDATFLPDLLHFMQVHPRPVEGWKLLSKESTLSTDARESTVRQLWDRHSDRIVLFSKSVQALPLPHPLDKAAADEAGESALLFPHSPSKARATRLEQSINLV